MLKFWYDLQVSSSFLFYRSFIKKFSVNHYLSYDVASGDEIKPCNKIDKPLVVYRFMGNVMKSIATLHT